MIPVPVAEYKAELAKIKNQYVQAPVNTQHDVKLFLILLQSGRCKHQHLSLEIGEIGSTESMVVCADHEVKEEIDMEITIKESDVIPLPIDTATKESDATPAPFEPEDSPPTTPLTEQ